MQERHGTTSKDMTQGPIVRQIVGFSLPLLLGNIFQMLYNVVDSAVMGQFVGKQALAAMGSTTPVVNVAVFFFAGFSIGASVLIGRHFGARETEKLHTAVETTMALTFVLCAAFTVVGVLGEERLLAVMSTPADVFGDASAYLRIYFAGISGLLVYNMCSGILRAVGDSVRPLYLLILTSLLNVVLDLAFVVGLGMGIEGASLATVVSQLVSAVLVLRLLTHTTDVYRFAWRDLCMNGTVLRGILTIGIPAGLQSAITSLSNVVVQSYINFFGATVMAGWTVYMKLAEFAMLLMQTISMAATTFVSQNVGARNITRVNKGTKYSLLLALTLTFAVVSVIELFAPQGIGLFTSDADVIDVGVRFVRVNLYFALFNCVNHVLAGALRGRGDSLGPMVIMLSCFVALRQTYLFVMANFISNTPATIGFGYPVGWMSCCVVEVTYFYLRWNRRERREALAG